MWNVRQILVPTDFSDCAAAALDAAIELAGKLGARITVLHAWQIPTYAFPFGSFVPAVDLPAALEDAAQKALAELVASRADRGVELRPMVRAGVAWEQILAVVKELPAELVVIGTHGRTGLPRALIGSVAEKVVRLAPVPVLTVHAGACA